jgi:hypothetical protein
MNKVRGLLWLCFLLITLIVVTCSASVWDRANDPIWSRMPDIRFAYDCVSAAIVVTSLAVAYGLWCKRQWGRIFGISLFAIVLFLFVGVPLLAPLLIGVPVTLGLWPVAVGALCIACIACIVLLSCQRRGGDSHEKPIQN